MWLCMLAISIDDLPTSSVMLLTNVISLIGIIILLDAHFGTMLRSSYRHKAAILIVSMPFMMTAALLAQPIVFFSLLVVAASCFIKERTEQYYFSAIDKCRDWQHRHPFIYLCGNFYQWLFRFCYSFIYFGFGFINY